jgi:hypothetical protein
MANLLLASQPANALRATLRVRQAARNDGEPFASQPANALRATLRVRQAARNVSRSYERIKIGRNDL